MVIRTGMSKVGTVWDSMIVSMIYWKPVRTLTIAVRTIRLYNLKAVSHTERLCGEYGYSLLAAWETWLEDKQNAYAAVDVADAAKRCAVEAQSQRFSLKNKSQSIASMESGDFAVQLSSNYAYPESKLMVELKSFEEATRELEQGTRSVANDPQNAREIDRCLLAFRSYANALQALHATRMRAK